MYFSRLLPVLLLCGISFSALYAQPRQITRFFMFTAKSSPQYSRILMKEEAERRMLQASQTAAARPLIQAEKQFAPSARFAARHKQTLWKLQTRAGISKRRAFLNLQKWGAFSSGFSKYPPLEKESFPIRDFAGLSPSPAGPVPAPPFYARGGYVFFGTVLRADGQDLRQILRQGFPAKDAPVQAAGQTPRALPADDPLSALRSALRGRTRDTVPVLFAVRNTNLSGDMAAQNNLPPSPITGAAVLLTRDGLTRWYRVAPQPDGFLITPYAIRPLPPQQQKAISKL